MTSWSSLLEHVLSTGAKPSNKEVSSQEQHLQEGPACWCRRSGSRFNGTLRSEASPQAVRYWQECDAGFHPLHKKASPSPRDSPPTLAT